MASDQTCDAGEMFQKSVDATQQLLEASTFASSGLALSWARSLNLTIASVVGLVCIWLGWRLYNDVVVGKTSGEVTWNKFGAKLASSGPGVFLVLFGAWLIYSVVIQRFQLDSESNQLPAASKKTTMISPKSHYPDVRILSVAASAPPSRDPENCLVRKRLRLSGQGGPESFESAANVDASLAYAIATIQTFAKRELAEGRSIDLANIDSTVTTLNRLRNGLVRDEVK
jgi:hypothetical protein